MSRPARRTGLDRARLSPYLVSAAAVGLATLVAFAVPLLRTRVTYFLFWPLVFLTAWRGGPGPGAIATALSSLAIAAFLIPDAVRASPDEMVALVTFTAVGAMAAVVARRWHSDERAVRESERHFHTIADTAPVLVWMGTPDRRCVYVNRRWLELTGRTIEQELGDGRVALVHPDDRGRYLDAYRAAFAARRPFEIEYRVRRHDGEYRWLLERGTVREANGQFLGYLGSSIDVTERRRAVEELAARADQQAAVAEIGQLGLTLADPTALFDTTVGLVARVLAIDLCTILELEPTGRAFVVRAGFGCRSGVVGRTRVPAGTDSQAGYTLLADEPVISDDLGQDPRFTASWFLRDHGAVSGIAVIIHGGDRPFGVLMAHAARRRRFTTDDGNFLSAVAHTVAAALGRDAALRRERTARAQAEDANTAKDAFLATVSHELRTPLTPILAWAGLLRAGTLGPDQRDRAAGVIEQNARVQAQLVGDLLDVSRIVSGKLRLNVHPVQLVPIIEAALETVRPAAEAKGIDLETAYAPEPHRVSGDPDRLQQVVWNLLSNAVKFTPAGGRVEVGLEHTDGHAVISVLDTGRGVRAEMLPRLFERFWQADVGATRAHGGLGLGLAIVRQIVEQHGGTVAAESAGPGRGSRFTVRLPLAHPARHGADATWRAVAAPERGSATEAPRSTASGAGAWTTSRN